MAGVSAAAVVVCAEDVQGKAPWLTSRAPTSATAAMPNTVLRMREVFICLSFLTELGLFGLVLI